MSDRITFYGFCDYGSCANDYIVSNFDTCENNCAGTNLNIVPNPNGLVYMYFLDF